MEPFYGEEKCLVDANGRVKLCPRYLKLFREAGEKLVLHCLPEKALAIYPSSVWQQIRQEDPRPVNRIADSLVSRRHLRRLGAFTSVEQLSNQGRLTIPPQFRERLNLLPGSEIYAVGCEVGIELWHAEMWLAESEAMTSHELERGQFELKADLDAGGQAGPNSF